ncbi:MAG: hypothetical protein SPH79_06950 [Schaalia hyovaginalis]|uniref:hypothetical protein n=1 Tax=Schaalia hyovaginalis TaxID=29316 RepID=UPI002A9108CE|nr:hypothetical protein [Schaalia hyovaginalis]MDY6214213.1 hypothetical protein [Schaalia hyovaginalis]
MIKRRSISADEYDRQQRSLVPLGLFVCVALLAIAFIAKDRYLLSVRPLFLASPLIFLPGIALGLRKSICRDLSILRGERIVLFEPLILTVFHTFYIIGFWIEIIVIIYSAFFRFTGLSGAFLVLVAIGLSDVVPRTLGLFRTSGRSYISFGVEGFEMRGSYGEVSRVLWSQKPRVVGVKRGVFLEVEPTVSGSGLAELWTLPIRYSTIERIVDYYVDHPEARAALGSEEGLRQIERLCR